MTDNEKAVWKITTTINEAIGEYLSSASFDQTLRGTIITVDDTSSPTTYTVKIDGMDGEYTLTSCIPNHTFSKLDKVWVKKPCGQETKKHICGIRNK